MAAPSFTFREVLTRARRTLHDSDSVRWPLPELFDYTNDAVREVALVKPSAVTRVVELSLVAGVVQSIPDQYHHLLKVTRNLKSGDSSPQGRAGAAAVTEIASLSVLDETLPNWSDIEAYPARKQLDHAHRDAYDPRVFYTVPANDGTGLVEAKVAEIPEDVAAPDNPTDISSYDGLDVPLPPVYRSAVVDYVLYRAHSKDAGLPGSAQRAELHMRLFKAALGQKTAADMEADSRPAEGGA
ncbi:UNVERIFIED_CONTAM: hypothetical protein BEN50_21755 [Euhalothece sp. KZN 001]